MFLKYLTIYTVFAIINNHILGDTPFFSLNNLSLTLSFYLIELFIIENWIDDEETEIKFLEFTDNMMFIIGVILLIFVGW